MGQHNEDAAMDPDKRKTVSPAYVLAAAAIWALVLYSLSPLSRSQPARLAMGPIQLCASR